MKWIKVASTGRIQPTTGKYNEWKAQIATDCGRQCVYCAIPESKYGGLDNYHVDHFRPKSIKRFARLENIIANLFLACAICNRFKSDDWPNDPANDNSIAAHIDPSVHDYNDVFELDTASFNILGKVTAAKYIIERLFLNRPQLIFERRTFSATKRIEAFEQFARDALSELQKLPPAQNSELLTKLLNAILDIRSAERWNAAIPPYEIHDIKRKGKVSGRKSTKAKRKRVNR